jgi:large subunit ribosomal protein L20
MRLKHKKIILHAKGYMGRGKNCYRTAVARVQRAWRHAYVGRKLRKRDMRQTWQVQINAGSRLLGVPYSRLVHCLPLSGILLDRKILADLARTEPYSFKAVVETVKQTGLHSWEEHMVQLNKENHEHMMAYREVQLGRKKPGYEFSEDGQSSRLAEIEGLVSGRRAREQEEFEAKTKAAIKEILMSDTVGEPWEEAEREFREEAADTERA